MKRTKQENKYNIGDKVYFMENNRPVFDTIKGMVTIEGDINSGVGNNVMYKPIYSCKPDRIHYANEEGVYYKLRSRSKLLKEEELFSSSEELKESLFEKNEELSSMETIDRDFRENFLKK